MKLLGGKDYQSSRGKNPGNLTELFSSRLTANEKASSEVQGFQFPPGDEVLLLS
jgi:hypothetical protein